MWRLLDSHLDRHHKVSAPPAHVRPCQRSLSGERINYHILAPYLMQAMGGMELRGPGDDGPAREDRERGSRPTASPPDQTSCQLDTKHESRTEARSEDGIGGAKSATCDGTPVRTGLFMSAISSMHKASTVSQKEEKESRRREYVRELDRQVKEKKERELYEKRERQRLEALDEARAKRYMENHDYRQPAQTGGATEPPRQQQRPRTPSVEHAPVQVTRADEPDGSSSAASSTKEEGHSDAITDSPNRILLKLETDAMQARQERDLIMQELQALKLRKFPSRAQACATPFLSVLLVSHAGVRETYRAWVRPASCPCSQRPRQ
eukprot:scaffold1658_cov393-Prasinococcus_capsulatus_cf.AAC.16